MEQGLRLQIAIDQVKFARQYTLSLIHEIDPADWFRLPTGGVSHVAWQVGHRCDLHAEPQVLQPAGQQLDDGAIALVDGWVHAANGGRGDQRAYHL